MNLSPTSPFTLVHFNAQALPAHQLATWQALASSADPSLPSTPLLYVFVETGHRPPTLIRGWTAFHLPGPIPPPNSKSGFGGGGISLLYHSDCPIRVLPPHTACIQRLSPADPSSSGVVCAIVRPKHRSAFLLVAVYLPPQCAKQSQYLDIITSHIQAASQSHPTLPLLVVGDFNCHHSDWLCPIALRAPIPGAPPAATVCANTLATWIDDVGLDISNPPGMLTRVSVPKAGLNPPQSSIIDLVLSTPGLVSTVSQSHASYLRSDHIPFTIELALRSTVPAARGPISRPRETWDQHRGVEAWQSTLPLVLSSALTPLQPLLASLSQPPPASSTAQSVMDSVYGEFERLLIASFQDVVGTKVVTPSSSPWLSYPGVRAARTALRSALKALQVNPFDPLGHQRLRTTRAAWRKVSGEAKQQSYTSLCQQIMQKDCKLRWSMFKRAAPSSFTSLASIADPITNALPIDHASSLDNLCSSFVANSQPPPPLDPSSHLLLEQRVLQWADPAHPTIPPHPSDTWSFSTAQVKEQCTHQHTNTAPGPDSVLPTFLKHAGPAVWKALASIYNFSWTHSVTPQAWREANVMALYKGAGDKSTAGSYRPISMTSIIVRTFEHLIHRRLAKELEDRHYFSNTQFGFRKGRSTNDAIHYLLSSIQRILGLEVKGAATPQCPVLFLDIQKAFDRVDHSILLQRVHDAGITGKAWLWIRSFLSARRMRCVDASTGSDWMSIQHGVPQGCVLSPLLFLIFINDLQRTISTDANCSLLSPTFFADDGTIGPHPTNPLPSAAFFEAQYLVQLNTAIAHLNAWCLASRMRFGSAKTQLVVFTLRKKPDTTLYQSLTLCSFPITLSTEYQYLGVYLTHRLTWNRHITHATQQARKASSLVTRVALRARPRVSVAAVRSLVQGYVIPSFSYGILFWGRPTSLSAAQRRALQAKAATPLRAALCLPTTTHQLSVLELCHIPTVESLALSAQLTHFGRACSAAAPLPPDHPTLLLHTASTAAALSRTGICTHAEPVLAPSAALATSVYIGVSLYPFICQTANIVAHLDQPTATSLLLPPPVGCAVGMRYWDQKSGHRRQWSILNFPYRADVPLQQPPRADLQTILRWSLSSAAHLTAPAIRSIRWLSAHAEWVAQHTPANHPAHLPLPPHTTTSPLTECKPSSGLAPFLHFRSPDSHYQQVSRARLLLGRSRTGLVQQRFAKAAVALTVSPHCSFCQAPTIESIPHVLLHCPRYAAVRAALSTDLSQLHPPLVPLSLSTILVASCPPRPFSSSQLHQLIRLTTSFLLAVAAVRTTAGLVPLDTG
jgi:hypothetical protein